MKQEHLYSFKFLACMVYKYSWYSVQHHRMIIDPSYEKKIVTHLIKDQCLDLFLFSSSLNAALIVSSLCFFFVLPSKSQEKFQGFSNLNKVAGGNYCKVGWVLSSHNKSGHVRVGLPHSCGITPSRKGGGGGGGWKMHLTPVLVHSFLVCIW